MNRPPVEVSVVVPCFDAARTLVRCLQSLTGQDTSIPHEILVIENGSRDGTPAIARAATEARPDLVRVVEEPVPGSYAARNRGLREARGRIVLFTDADCVAAPGWLRNLAASLDDPEVLLAGGDVLPDPSQEGLVARHAARSGILSRHGGLGHPRGPFLQTANLGVRREDAVLAGGFDATLYSGGDADFCWRLLARHRGRRIAPVPDAAVTHIHRETLGGLWRQFRRYGQADVALMRRHGLLAGPGLVKLLADAFRVLLAPLLAVLMIPLAILRGDGLSCIDPLLRAFRILARRAGQISALIDPGGARRH